MTDEEALFEVWFQLYRVKPEYLSMGYREAMLEGWLARSTLPAHSLCCRWDDDPDEGFKHFWRTDCGNHGSRTGYKTIPPVCPHCDRPTTREPSQSDTERFAGLEAELARASRPCHNCGSTLRALACHICGFPIDDPGADSQADGEVK